jgi:ankyrin repeat protein
VVEGLLQRSKLKSLDGMKNKRELTPLHLAVLIGDSAIFDAVLKLTQNVNVLMGFDTPLCVAIPSGAKIETIQALLDKGADPEIPNGLGQRPLHLALLGSQNEISKLLIERGVNLRVTALGVTPLELAVATGRKEICELLISRDKTLVSLAGDDGDTPLHAAAELGDVELTQLLLKHGADSWAKNKKGRSAIDVAEEKWKKTKERRFSQVLSLLERL